MCRILHCGLMGSYGLANCTFTEQYRTKVIFSRFVDKLWRNAMSLKLPLASSVFSIWGFQLFDVDSEVEEEVGGIAWEKYAYSKLPYETNDIRSLLYESGQRIVTDVFSVFIYVFTYLFIIYLCTHNIKSKFPPKEPHQICQCNKLFKLKPSMGYS